MAEQTIPVVDLRDWEAGGATRERFVHTLGEALEDTGFFAVTHHGVDPDLIKAGYAQAAKLFEELGEAQKRRYEDPALKGQRGYVSFGKEHAKGARAPDLKEFWHVGQELPAGDPLGSVYAHNLWPTELPDFRRVMLGLYGQLEACAKRLLEASSLYLGEPQGLMREMVSSGDTILRIIHYPPVPPERDPASVRAAAHEDINFITLLCESTDAGLELLQRDGKWRPIHALQGQIIVDAGDMLQHLTNGAFKSTTHRVVNPSSDRSRRYSMPFFVHPRGEVDLSPLPSCVKRTGGQAQYPNRTAREYLLERLREIGLA